MTTKTTTAHIGAIQDLTVATEFLMTALRELSIGAAPGDREVRQWVNLAVAKLEPLRR
ncbi:hypothetical protein [Defluviimonas sp. WL0075]|uniref:Uncharacterized protein n=1 Tax=Albidovulum sediminicola TaxID=2984331 RepID=A0ABT2YWT5_9RHOB|nr:hypothetical protein [Defluviimonas sp. WL0075]MCV2863338.1 hypothetical protein [Defluviimonas sp. WL0075]